MDQQYIHSVDKSPFHMKTATEKKTGDEMRCEVESNIQIDAVETHIRIESCCGSTFFTFGGFNASSRINVTFVHFNNMHLFQQGVKL